MVSLGFWREAKTLLHNTIVIIGKVRLQSPFRIAMPEGNTAPFAKALADNNVYEATVGRTSGVIQDREAHEVHDGTRERDGAPESLEEAVCLTRWAYLDLERVERDVNEFERLPEGGEESLRLLESLAFRYQTAASLPG